MKKFILTEAKESKKVVIYLPGISGDVFNQKYDVFPELFKEAGFCFLRYNFWHNRVEFSQLSISSIHQELDKVIYYLKEKGFTEISLLGKSFGGGIALAYRNPEVKSMVLWSQAFGIEESGTIREWINKPLQGFKSTLNISFDKKFFQDLIIPIGLLHGTLDEKVPPENSKKLLKILLQANLVILPATKHSNNLNLVAKEAINFLNIKND
ncbi:MAG: hypothetical protein ABIH82_01395 [Candidatus Woesearchaeota archaeon]